MRSAASLLFNAHKAYIVVLFIKSHVPSTEEEKVFALKSDTHAHCNIHAFRSHHQPLNPGILNHRGHESTQKLQVLHLAHLEIVWFLQRLRCASASHLLQGRFRLLLDLKQLQPTTHAPMSRPFLNDTKFHARAFQLGQEATRQRSRPHVVRFFPLPLFRTPIPSLQCFGRV